MHLQEFDENMRKEGFTLIAGVDEAGRGPLAGPVVAAACIIPSGITIESINDSKLLTPEMREEIYHLLVSHEEILYGIGICDATCIEKRNILQATFDAMNQAVEALPTPPDYLLIDGKFLPKTNIAAQAVVKGDGKSQCIAAASILAKYTRDQIMIELHKKWPKYGFDKHKGYGTDEHISAIKKYGVLPEIHRRTFAPIKSMLTPDLFTPSGSEIGN